MPLLRRFRSVPTFFFLALKEFLLSVPQSPLGHLFPVMCANPAFPTFPLSEILYAYRGRPRRFPVLYLPPVLWQAPFLCDLSITTSIGFFANRWFQFPCVTSF